MIREHERARLKRLLAEVPPGNLTDEEAARLGDEIRDEVSSASEPRPASSGRWGSEDAQVSRNVSRALGLNA